MADLPTVGKLRRGKELGYKSNRYYIWQACITCGKERWVQYRKFGSLRCALCSLVRQERKNWKGGWHTSSDGYVRRLLRPDNPFYSMADKSGYVREHRLVMAQKLGRCLLMSEQVHHLDGNKGNNVETNLLLVSQANHTIYTELCLKCGLRKDIRLMRWQIKQLEEQVRNLTSTLMGIK